MRQPSLSFLISTYNKIDYLKVILNDLVKNVELDEEIIVVDGGSTDGTADFLREMSDKKLINNFISERDAGEGHGFNKAILLSKGKIVTILTDDDAFNFASIRRCKSFMLENPKIDFLFAGGADYQYLKNNNITYFTYYEPLIQEYIISNKPFSFCLLGSMINKNSLPLLGFISPVIKRADAEYSLRITSAPIKIAFCALPTFVRILNDKSNSSMFNEKIKKETDKLNAFYDFSIDGPVREEKPISLLRKVKNKVGGVYNKISTSNKINNLPQNLTDSEFVPYSYKKAFDYAKNWLANNNEPNKTDFLSNL